MLLLNLILLVLLHVVLPGASGILEDFEESCENPLRCPFDLDFFRKPPFSQSELNAFCLEVVSYFECLDYAKSHFEQEKECELEYLEHAKCYRKIDISIECDKYALNRMKLYDVATPDPKLPEHSIKGVRKCMAASLKANCFGIRIYEECGEEAEQMFYKIFNGTQLYSQYCPGFTHALARKRSEAILKTIDTLLIEY
ncbi:hypothetical protein TNIN_5601 [Trichonephila inaurata madagascariensis]|uniref:DUF19 domain-containing protein n=1 Tax=Trichonephila inaurata madagascariensis TaxID=2747483 RepID=A0A8X7CI21_9ARAC|nr:hypothetical protein TNIN_5601 [Trichonephila inaurata madagascariensis]